MLLRSVPTHRKKREKACCCVHSLGVAIMRRTLVAPRAAQVQLLGRNRRRGRRPLAAPAWELMEIELNAPIQHPQQDDDILLGLPVPDIAADLIAE